MVESWSVRTSCLLMDNAHWRKFPEHCFGETWGHVGFDGREVCVRPVVFAQWFSSSGVRPVVLAVDVVRRSFTSQPRAQMPSVNLREWVLPPIVILVARSLAHVITSLRISLLTIPDTTQRGSQGVDPFLVHVFIHSFISFIHYFSCSPTIPYSWIMPIGVSSMGNHTSILSFTLFTLFIFSLRFSPVLNTGLYWEI